MLRDLSFKIRSCAPVWFLKSCHSEAPQGLKNLKPKHPSIARMDIRMLRILDFLRGYYGRSEWPIERGLDECQVSSSQTEWQIMHDRAKILHLPV